MSVLLFERQNIRHIRQVIKQYAKYSTTSSEEYQYLHRSEIPTLHFQTALPRLPIPKLEKTCERYLEAQRPLIPIAEAFEKTEANVKRFITSSGKLLHNALVEQDNKNKHTSYISAPWFDMYLKDRKPLPINYNPALIHVRGPKPEYETQLLKATNMVISSLRFMRSLRANILKPEVFFVNPKTPDQPMFTKIAKTLPPFLSYMYCYMNNAYPLDMSQYDHLFNSTRVPELDKDMIVQDVRAKHILVMRNGHFYIFDVLNSLGEILPPEDILAKIKNVLDDPRPPNPLPLGILTTENRNVWATARHLLLKLGNEKTLRLIDSALFNLVLDDDQILNDNVKLVRHFLHGNGKNRWFDKSISLIVTKDAVTGVNFEHSWGDGVAVLRYFNDIYKDSTRKPQVHPDTKPASSVTPDHVTHLDVNLDDQMSNIIKSTIHKYDQTCSSLDINILEFDGIGKKICKKNAISPDSVMQLGFQSAYFKLFGNYTATYESCSTAAFKHGRTETMRPCTVATKDFCDSFNLKKETNHSALRDKIKKCSEVHSQLTKEAAMGQGFDRHLFALKYLAEKMGRPKPSIFGDLAYEKLNHNILSTSTLSSPHVWAGGFGPVVQDGYGIAYTIMDDSLGVALASYQGQKNGAEFIDALRQSYKEILNILSQN
ncbi:carnitine O-palmitoyltransferase 2, mitochondrial [Chrysoperla carnea]|uniref:carnitine O-palmitoyltransferase 2, mitochondrial n=1 Tax=Chrysoperla carnea TaxID=189513 RepID=UPI001D064665|nr:carnitine O-palmitoyltransferase 2, mitochondrial [Chrysoperla carnea]